MFDFLQNPTFWVAIEAIATAITLIYLARQNVAMKKSYRFDVQ